MFCQPTVSGLFVHLSLSCVLRLSLFLLIGWSALFQTQLHRPSSTQLHRPRSTQLHRPDSTQLHRPRSCREIPSIVKLRNDERFYRSQRMSSPSLFARTCPGCPAKDGWSGMLGRTIVCVYNPWQAGMFATIFFNSLSLLPPILSVFLSL